MHSTLTLLLPAIMATGVLGDAAPIPGYKVEVLQWDVEVRPGEMELLNGTVQEIYAQALQMNPKFTIGDTLQTDLEARSMHQKRDVKCWGFDPADTYPIVEGLNYLRGLRGNPHIGPGPHACSRVSCSWNAAIWWCNENSSPLTLNSWDQIVNSAQHLFNLCAKDTKLVAGKNTEAGNWNTLIKYDKC